MSCILAFRPLLDNIPMILTGGNYNKQDTLNDLSTIYYSSRELCPSCLLAHCFPMDEPRAKSNDIVPDQVRNDKTFQWDIAQSFF